MKLRVWSYLLSINALIVEFSLVATVSLVSSSFLSHRCPFRYQVSMGDDNNFVNSCRHFNEDGARLLMALKNQVDNGLSSDVVSKKGECYESMNTERFTIREARLDDLKIASDILTDSFYADLNFFARPLEWLKTYLSLEDTFKEVGDKDSHYMFVACSSDDDSVCGFCEIDSRTSTSPSVNVAPRPYMCNLAVDKKFRGLGIAKMLIFVCESKVLSWNEEIIHLRVRPTNKAALRLYTTLGYEGQGKSDDEEIILLKKRITPSS